MSEKAVNVIQFADGEMKYRGRGVKGVGAEGRAGG